MLLACSCVAAAVPAVQGGGIMLGNSDDGGSCLVTAMMVVMVAVYGWLRQTSLPGGIWHPADLLLLGSVNPGSDFGLSLQSLPYLCT